MYFERNFFTNENSAPILNYGYTLKFHGIHVLVVTLVLKMLCQCTIDLEYSITYYNFTMFVIYCTSDSEYCVSLF